MEKQTLNYIVIYDEIVENKLNIYENIFNICKENENNLSLFFINNDKKNHDLYVNILCKSEIIIEGLVSGKVDIYYGENIKEFLENSFCIFYFLKYKNDYFTKNIKEIINLNKFILHKNMDKYKALINVLKDLNHKNHIFNQNNFLNYYHKLEGTEELNLIFNKYINKDIDDNNVPKKIKLIKKVIHEEEEKEEGENEEEEKEEEKKKEEKEEEEKEEEKEEEEKEEEKKEEEKEEEKKEEEKKEEKKNKIEKNISIQLNKNDDMKVNNVYITFYNHTLHNLTNDIQIKCIIENCKNKLFNKYVIYHDNKNEYLIDYFKNELNEEFIQNIIFIHNEDGNILKINKVIDYINKNYIGDIIYLSRSDILIPEQNNIKNIQFKLFENNYVYAISRIERKLDGTMFKESAFNNLLYSHLQDLYIFKAQLHIDIKNNIEIYGSLDFYETKFEILFNKILENNGYYIINDTNNCKILRILCNNDANERYIMKECKIDYKDYNCSYIAENNILNKFNLENYLKNMDLNEDELYLVKQYIFKLFIKKNDIM